MEPDPRATWIGRTGQHQTYQVLGGGLFASYRGYWRHILSFCLDDPEQGPVVMLPIVWPVTPKG